ncbi:hypothetical protein AC1031_013337 [Aphanomyces cochlioides]|nr:hypothetical protein AC1031_013337 [Aphanomyces cochlioides]
MEKFIDLHPPILLPCSHRVVYSLKMVESLMRMTFDGRRFLFKSFQLVLISKTTRFKHTKWPHAMIVVLWRECVRGTCFVGMKSSLVNGIAEKGLKRVQSVLFSSSSSTIQSSVWRRPDIVVFDSRMIQFIVHTLGQTPFWV